MLNATDADRQLRSPVAMSRDLKRSTPPTVYYYSKRRPTRGSEADGGGRHLVQYLTEPGLRRRSLGIALEPDVYAASAAWAGQRLDITRGHLWFAVMRIRLSADHASSLLAQDGSAHGRSVQLCGSSFPNFWQSSQLACIAQRCTRISPRDDVFLLQHRQTVSVFLSSRVVILPCPISSAHPASTQQQRQMQGLDRLENT